MTPGPRPLEEVPVQLARLEEKVDAIKTGIQEVKANGKTYAMEKDLEVIRQKQERLWGERNMVRGALILLSLLSGGLALHIAKLF